MILKALTPEEYIQILQYVDKHHRFGFFKEGSLNIKYVENSFDSRSRGIWSVTFRGLGEGVPFRTNSFIMISDAESWVPYTRLFDWIMDYLAGNWSPGDYWKFPKKQLK